MKSQTAHFVKAFTVTILLATLSVGCQKNALESSDGSKSISLFITDDPSVVFDNVFVDIQKIEVKAEDEDETEIEHHGGSGSGNGSDDDNGSTSGGWMTLSSSARVVDILKFRNGLDTLISTGSFQSARTLKKVRITLGNNNTGVLNGATVALKLKKNTVIINLEDERIEQKNIDNVKIWLDIDAGRSIRRSGNQFEFEPGINAFSREKAGSIEGRVAPLDARAIVTAISGTDTATAKPEREGEFKIIGLKAGTYKLIVHSTTNSYADAVLSNITVRTKDDSHVGTITLRK